MFVARESCCKCGDPSTVLSAELEYFGGNIVLTVSYYDEFFQCGPNSAIIFFTKQCVTSQMILLK